MPGPARCNPAQHRLYPTAGRPRAACLFCARARRGAWSAHGRTPGLRPPARSLARTAAPFRTPEAPPRRHPGTPLLRNPAPFFHAPQDRSSPRPSLSPPRSRPNRDSEKTRPPGKRKGMQPPEPPPPGSQTATSRHADAAPASRAALRARNAGGTHGRRTGNPGSQSPGPTRPPDARPPPRPARSGSRRKARPPGSGTERSPAGRAPSGPDTNPPSPPDARAPPAQPLGRLAAGLAPRGSASRVPAAIVPPSPHRPCPCAPRFP